MAHQLAARERHHSQLIISGESQFLRFHETARALLCYHQKSVQGAREIAKVLICGDRSDAYFETISNGILLRNGPPRHENRVDGSMITCTSFSPKAT